MSTSACWPGWAGKVWVFSGQYPAAGHHAAEEIAEDVVGVGFGLVGHGYHLRNGAVDGGSIADLLGVSAGTLRGSSDTGWLGRCNARFRRVFHIPTNPVS